MWKLSGIAFLKEPKKEKIIYFELYKTVSKIV